jgi:peptidyl-prolyl cis-trans isomerase B (cyclophilin B)
MKRFAMSVLAAGAILGIGAGLRAAEVFPVKAYTKPDEPMMVRFVNEKSEEGKKAAQELGTEAGKLDALYSAAPAGDVTGAFKIYAASGEEQKLTGAAAVNADGTVDLSAALPKLKEGGTFFLVWKDAPPLVIETLYNPGRGPKELAKIKSQIDQLPPDQQKQALASYAPVVTHMEMAMYAVITTDKGVIKARFAYDAAPHTIDNFVTLARQGFYDGSAFHRIISGFMIQGGDAWANVEGSAGMGGPGYQVMHEFSDKKHVRGVLSMARSSEVDSAGSQFFIMHGANANLDGSYSAFGDVFEGMDVVDAIAKTPTSDSNGTVRGPKPKIVSVRIVPATVEIYGLKK